MLIEGPRFRDETNDEVQLLTIKTHSTSDAERSTQSCFFVDGLRQHNAQHYEA